MNGGGVGVESTAATGKPSTRFGGGGGRERCLIILRTLLYQQGSRDVGPPTFSQAGSGWCDGAVQVRLVRVACPAL